ncbi:hypothetical protein SNEBB_000567 [Seison nebaliae]|nr:hypothetical protein SNEBB_000567 [Seison nebaliae]
MNDDDRLIEDCLRRLEKYEKVPEENAHRLLTIGRSLLVYEDNVKMVEAPVCIVGDIHGQFHDLLELLRLSGGPDHVNYIFLGDYVDRGVYSVETLLYLIALKCRYRHRITLLRGNHESRDITKIYGFYDECLQKYNVEFWHLCTRLFDQLCLAAIINERIFCVHGGLSPTLMQLDEIRNIDRCREVPQEGSMCDLLWSDPNNGQKNSFEPSPRGAGFLFGDKAMDKFLEVNHLDNICRAHQLVMDGYAWSFDSHKLVTIWSAPNYCYRCGNLASVMNWTSDLQNNFLLYREYPTSLREHIHQKHIEPRTGLPLQTHRNWPDNIYPPKYQTLVQSHKNFHDDPLNHNEDDDDSDEDEDEMNDYYDTYALKGAAPFSTVLRQKIYFI